MHRLNKDEHGRVKCVACMLCATACPAHCIDIVGATAPPSWPDREKYPENFVIDELRCIYCGMCEEACPVEAIELTGLYDLTGLSREEMIFDKTKLLSVFDVTKDQEPMPYGKAERGHSADTKILAEQAVSSDATRGKKNAMTTGDVILAALVVVLGAAGTFLLLPHRHGAARPRRLHAAGALVGEPWALAVSLFLEAARGARCRRFSSTFSAWVRSSGACSRSPAATRSTARSGLRWS